MEETRNKRIKKLTKVMHIIDKICRIFIIIMFIGVLLGLIAVPVVGNSINVDTSEEKITILDHDVSYERGEDKITIFDGEEHVDFTGSDEIEIFDKMLEFFDGSEFSKAIICLELLLIFAEVVICLAYFTLKEIDKVFVNVNKDDSPFGKDNPIAFKKTAYYLIAIMVVKVISDIIVGIIIGNISFNISLTTIFIILSLFTLSYIFEYGYELQNKED